MLDDQFAGRTLRARTLPLASAIDGGGFLRRVLSLICDCPLEAWRVFFNAGDSSEGAMIQAEVEAKIEAGDDEKTKEFLASLTELSIRYGIAITGNAQLFIMEPEDYDTVYRVDSESRLSFG